MKSRKQTISAFFSEGSETGDNNPLLNIGTHNSGADATVDIFLRNGGSPGHQHSFAEAFDGEWHHITLIRDNDEMLLYVDGELDDTEWTFLDTYRPGVTNTTSVGGILRASPSHWIDGLIDEVSLWRGALSAEAVAELASGNPIGGGGGSDFAITDVELTEGNLTITWNSRTGQFYALDQSPNLNDWAEIEDSIESEGASTSITIPIGDQTDVYYRVREQE